MSENGKAVSSRGGTVFRMVQVLVLSALVGGALYFVLWYLYLGAIWLSRFSRDPYFGGVAHSNVAPFELPAALGCMLLVAAFLGAGSSAEVDHLQGLLDQRELEDKIAEIETKQKQTY
jgi:hypothetical protein